LDRGWPSSADLDRICEGWRSGPIEGILAGVNTILLEVERRADGKAYPVRFLSPAERARARVLAHRLHCREGLTVRATQRALAAEHGLRRSLGSIMKDLQGWECPQCA
jgi:hypothetical protein